MNFEKPVGVMHRRMRHQRFRNLLHKLLSCTHQGLSESECLSRACSIFSEFSGCDLVQFLIFDNDGGTRFICWSEAPGVARWHSGIPGDAACPHDAPGSDTIPEAIRAAVMGRDFMIARPFVTRGGSFYTGDTALPIHLKAKRGRSPAVETVVIGGDFASLALIPFRVEFPAGGLLQVGSRRRAFLTKSDVQLYEAAAEMLGASIAHQRTQAALHERVKQLTCLYDVAHAMQNADRTTDAFLADIADRLPHGWQHPKIACARITLDGLPFASAGFQNSPWKQSAEIVVKGLTRGNIEVFYTAEKPPADEGPFSRAERCLLQEVARQLSVILERMETEKENARLEHQLRHADRLATIGELAAGTAHELNEPLGSILGFAQLAKNSPNLPDQAEQDIDKIVNAALHAREVIKKLLIFARQVPTHKAPCNLNNLVREGLLFLESRCEREGISLVRRLDDGIPEITVDSAQLHQVLVNLVVNAIQAMPQGGTLSIRTLASGSQVLLVVEDTGIGMSDAVMKQLFIPFFTTKGIGQGTGLGLSVVHGIVTSHGGTIRVDSQKGKGSRFVVSLPLSGVPDSEENT
jgi:two-component system, NtrC family, sensor kinase